MRAPPLTPLAAAALHVPAPERVLVVGCGDGEPALFLAREFPSARIRGLDPSAERIRAASARVGLDPEGRIAFKVGKARKLPYPDDFFDLVIQLDGHPSPAEAARVLRPAGHLVLAWSSAPRFGAGFLQKLTTLRPARHSFVTIRAEPAGDGGFQVMQLKPRERGLSR